MAEQTDFSEALQGVFTAAAEGMEVSEVLSVWAPVVHDDEALARGIAERLAIELKAALPGTSDDELDRLIQFGAAAGAMSLRTLFEPFVSDGVVVTYAEGSDQDQTDAVRRVTNGLGVDQNAII